jgi:choline-sulfatase
MQAHEMFQNENAFGIRISKSPHPAPTFSPSNPMRPLPAILALFTLVAPIFAQQKPNILFIFSDDQSHETIRAYGHTDIDTPNLDRLSASGASFSRAYNMGAWHGAVCVASRTMLVTGRTLWRARGMEKSLNQESTAGHLWPQRMAAQGYETYFSGKWHILTDPEKCFDHVVNKRPGMPGAVQETYNRPISGQPDPWSPSDPQFGGFWKGGKHWSEVLGDDSIAFIEQAAKSDKPFFMYLAFNAPHDPRQSPKEYVDRYPLDRIKVPGNFLTEYPDKEAMGAGKDLRDEQLAPFPRDEHAVKTHRQEYYAIVTHMDTQVGRILDALEKSGEADNTWIIFTSDHGLACGHHGLMGKQNMYEHSLRVPFLVKGPGVKAGAKIDAPIHLQDAMATALDLAGADRDGIEFQSVRPLLDGGGHGLDAVYAAYMDTQRAVIHDGWKLVLYPEAKVAKLFHLVDDPQEMKNLAADPAMAGRMKTLFATFRELQKKYDDPLDLAKVFPGLQ